MVISANLQYNRKKMSRLITVMIQIEHVNIVDVAFMFSNK